MIWENDPVSDQIDTRTAWLSPDMLRQVRANVPLVYVDAIPVRVDSHGRVTQVGLLLRVAADGSISRMLERRDHCGLVQKTHYSTSNKTELCRQQPQPMHSHC